MGQPPDTAQIGSAARILLICPECGQENSEYIQALRGMASYSCRGDGCDYDFDLAGAHRDIGQSFAEAFRRFYAAFYPLRGQGAR